MIDVRLGPYLTLGELGTGGMGTVYLAEVVENAPGLDVGDRVALKVIHGHLMSTPGFFKRFLREGEVGRRIRHENVVATYDVDGTEVSGETVLFMATEFVQGQTPGPFSRSSARCRRSSAGTSRSRSPAASRPSTPRTSSTATSSPRTSSSAPTTWSS